MTEGTPIEWTHRPGTRGETWNPVVGCDIVSPGCTNCYAMKMAGRIERMGGAAHYAGTTRRVNGKDVWSGKVHAAPDHILTLPIRWKKPRTVFVNSMSDLFHEDLPDETIDRIYAVMSQCPQHTFIVLTKRAERMRDYLNKRRLEWRLSATVIDLPLLPPSPGPWPHLPLRNVWLGVSVEDQLRADERIPHLLATPAAIRWISAEPLLGPVDLKGWCRAAWDGDIRNRRPAARVEWVVAGGESGSGARPMHPDWARSLRDQCAEARVPFFFKQWGAWTPGENVDRQSGIVETASLWDDAWDFSTENLAVTDGHIDDEPDLYRLGKKVAGRHLDGELHNAFPEPRS